MHKGVGPEQEPHTLQREQADNGFKRLLHRLLPNCNDWKHFTKLFKQLKHAQHTKVRRPSEITQEAIKVELHSDGKDWSAGERVDASEKYTQEGIEDEWGGELSGVQGEY